MKRAFVLMTMICIAAFSMLSCGQKKDEKKSDDPYGGGYESAKDKEPSAEEMIEEGKTLVSNSDCKTCHHATNKIVGPSHTEVAQKYEFTDANVKMLAQKIIKGGSGVWGSIAMTPHVNLSEADAEKMAMYVLSLDGEKPH